jgi:hypothetical protein
MNKKKEGRENWKKGDEVKKSLKKKNRRLHREECM